IQIFSGLTMPVEVWAYGSRVNGTAHSGSDLDLVIRSQNLTPLPIDVFINLQDSIRESNIPILVELQDWARLPERFRRNIEQQYEVLFSNAEMMVNEPPAKYKTRK
ncbi:MAG: nucleotidyltransferase domain-containing protein, partial [Calditrichaeota bacterium]|nr:nucleotidyltransferase domain-containing protein [Calditrichota bacterium]